MSGKNIPSLSELDPRRLQRLRSNQHHELKNTLMMMVLMSSEWFVEYRQKLSLYRNGSGDLPMYPEKRVDDVERAVDLLLSTSVTSKGR